MFLGTPYRWGGDDPMAGFDCSGLAIEVLRAFGRLAQGGDYTANDLLTIFRPNKVDVGYEGCLCFYLDSGGRAVHVVILVNEHFAIGADGGGSGTNTPGDAVAQNAFVKIRPVDYRPGPRVIVDPWKGLA